MTKLEDVYHEWQNNPIFREKFKKNPELALKEFNFDLNEADFKKIQSILKKDSNDTLPDRINK